MTANRFYVYLHIDPRTNKVVYIGKGTGNRMSNMCKPKTSNQSGSGRSKEHYKWHMELKKIGLSPIFKKVIDNVSEKKSYEIERKTIVKYLDKGYVLFNRIGYGRACAKSKVRDPKRVKIRIQKMKDFYNKNPHKRKEISNRLKKTPMPWKIKQVKCLDTGKIWDSVGACAKTLKVSYPSISKVLTGVSPHCKGRRLSYL